jgi:acid phosphatase type 7
VSGSQVRYNGDYGALLVDATDTNITFHFISRKSVSVDLYSIDATLSAEAPDLPGNLAATTVSSSHIVLGWTDNPNNESGFKIERSTNGTSFTHIVTVGTNVKSYSNTGLAANTWYSYRVRDYNASGNSAQSNTDRTKTEAH